MKRLSVTAFALLLLLGINGRAEEGGYKDTATGKVWLESIRGFPGGGVDDFLYCRSFAAAFNIWDVNTSGVPTLYDDWRLPTVKEMQDAIANGTLQHVNQNANYKYSNVNFGFHTSDVKGSKNWVVWVQFGPNGEVIGNSVPELRPYKPTALWSSAYMIRP